MQWWSANSPGQVKEGLVELVGMMEEVLEHHQVFLEGKEVGGVQCSAVQCSAVQCS